jgi:DNA-binding transcriptional regulator of glucitol operon
LNALANDFSTTGHHITFSSLGLAYENGPLRTQMELSHYGSETLTFPATNTGYLSVGYRHGKFTPYAVISAARSKKSSRADELAGKGVDSIVSIGNFVLTTGQEVQHTYSVGMRYDLTSNAALKFQMDMIHNHTCSPVSLPVIGPSPPCSSPLLWQTVPVSWDGRANVYSAVLDFTF